MLKRLTLLIALALGLAAPGFPQTETNLNNFGSAPVFQLTTPTNGQCLSYSSATATWINNACGAGGILFNAITSGTNTTATMLVGTGGSLAASGTGTITATALASSAAINLTKNFSFTGNYLGPSSGVNIYGWTGTMSGTNSTSTPLAGVNALDFAVTSDTYVNTIGNQLVGAVGILHNFGGAFQGSANAMSVNLSLTSPTTNTIGTGQYPVATFVGQFNTGDNGTLGTPSGALFGLNPNIRLLNNVTYAQQLIGQETDIQAQGAALTAVSITGTAGQFSATSSITLVVGQAVNISGTLGGTGSITGYTTPSLYLISATNGTTTFTLTTVTGSALVTTAGTPTGLTYTVGASVSDIIGHQIVESVATDLPGRRTNLGYSVNNGTGAPGFDIEFVDGSYTGFSALASNGTILGVWPHGQNRPATGVSAGTTGCGVDFAGLCLGGSKTFTTAAFASSGFKIDGSGNVLNSTAGGIVGIGRDAAAVYNGACVVPATTGNSPVIKACGVDANRPMIIEGSGTGLVGLGNTTNGVGVRALDCGAACVNLLGLQGNGTGNGVVVSNQTGDTSGTGLAIQVSARSATVNGAGGAATLSAGNGFGTAGNGGAVSITAGNGGASTGNGGNITLTPGAVTSGTAGVIQLAGPTASAGTTFTVGSGTGACATSGTLQGGVQAGNLTCTGTTGASTVTLTLAATTNAYSCWGRDITTPTTVTQTGAKSTTSVTLTLTSVTANDVVQFGCLGY